MKKTIILSGALSLVLLGAMAAHAEKWEKNRYSDKTVESAFYDVDSIKTEGKVVSWTEKYVLRPEGGKVFSTEVSKYPACKENIAKKGEIAQSQLDFQIEGKNYREAAIRHYNKNGELVCSDKDMAKEFDTSWKKIIPRSPIQAARYDLVTKYKVNFP